MSAFYFDQAVYTFGVTFDQDMEEASKSRGKKPDTEEQTKRKRDARLKQWLNDGSTPAVKTGSGFRDPNVGM